MFSMFTSLLDSKKISYVVIGVTVLYYTLPILYDKYIYIPKLESKLVEASREIDKNMRELNVTYTSIANVVEAKELEKRILYEVNTTINTCYDCNISYSM